MPSVFGWVTPEWAPQWMTRSWEAPWVASFRRMVCWHHGRASHVGCWHHTRQGGLGSPRRSGIISPVGGAKNGVGSIFLAWWKGIVLSTRVRVGLPSSSDRRLLHSLCPSHRQCHRRASYHSSHNKTHSQFDGVKQNILTKPRLVLLL